VQCHCIDVARLDMRVGRRRREERRQKTREGEQRRRAAEGTRGDGVSSAGGGQDKAEEAAEGCGDDEGLSLVERNTAM
jgi:hypothetical protein